MSKQTKLVEEKEIKVCKAIPIEIAEDLAKDLTTFTIADCIRMDVVGSIRRGKDTVNDIDFVVVATIKGWDNIKKTMEEKFKGKKVLSGPKILRYIVSLEIGNVQVDIYRGTEDNYGILKLVRTGSEEHNIFLAKYAIKRKMRLLYSQGLLGLIDGKYTVIATTEGDVLRCLGVGWIEPQQREIVNGKPVWLK